MGRRRFVERCTLAASLAALALTASASSAAASVTIGSNLGRQPDLISQYNPRATFSNVSLAPDRQAPGGLVSPVNGTVVRWRIRVGATYTGVVNFRIIRSLGGGMFTGAGVSAPKTPPVSATTPYDVQLPIRIGDYIGLDCCNDTAVAFFVSAPGGATTANWWQPILADGGPGRAADDTDPFEVALNADIEPTSSLTFGAITRNKKKGTATLSVEVPNPGELSGSGKGVKVASAAVTSKAVGPGQATLTIKAKGKKKRKLNETGKVKVNPTITYTPTGGSPSIESAKVKLKKKL